MANLTREQRAAKEASQAETAQEPTPEVVFTEPPKQARKDDGLVTMTNGADELLVHPSCVKAHESAGWKVVG